MGIVVLFLGHHTIWVDMPNGYRMNQRNKEGLLAIDVLVEMHRWTR